MQWRNSKRTAGGLIPLLLCGLTATVPAVSAREASPTKDQLVPTAASECRALKCAVGESRIYDYSAVFTSEADVDTVTESGYASATLTGEAQATLTAVADRNSLCTYAVSLKDVKVAEVVRGEPVAWPRDEEVSTHTEETYYFTQAPDGQIVDVMLDREENPEATTFKRGVINAFNVTLRSEDRYEVEERDISGAHQAVYSVRTLEDRTVLDRKVEKGGDSLLKAAVEAFGFESQQSTTVTLDHHSCAIAQVNIDEVVVIDQPDASDPAVSNHFHHETLTVRAAANMTLRSTTATSSIAGPTKLDLGGMVRLPVDAPVSVSPRSIGDQKNIYSLLESLEAGTHDPQQIRTLARAMRADDAGIDVMRAFIDSRQPTASLARSLGTLLIGVGTDAAQAVLAESLLTSDQDDDILERLIGLSTLIESPTPGLVKTVSTFANESQTGLGAAANLALGAYAEKLQESQPKIAAQLVSELETRLRLAGGADDAILYLRALGNAGAESSLPLIVSYLDSSDRLLRLSSVIATRKIASAQVEDELLGLWVRESSQSVQQAITRVIYDRAEKGLNEQSALAKAVIIDWSWALQVGGNFLNAQFSASALVEDEPFLVDLQAASTVNGPLGFSQNLLDVQLLTEEVNAQNRRFRFFIMLLNNEIANIDDTETCSVNGENTIWEESITLLDLSTPPIPIIGPLTLNFDLDLSLEFYINFFREGDWCTANSNLQMGLTPGVGITADGYATLTLWPLRGGLGIGGRLIGIELPIYADADMRFQDAPEVCFTIDVQLLAADMDLYAWGQVHTIFAGWRPRPRPRWVLWSFDLSPDAWNLVSECDQNPDLNCIPDVLWWDGSTIDAWFDGANCFVTSPPANSQPFIANNAYYIQADTSCPSGMPWNGTGCFEATFNVLPSISVSLFPVGGQANLFFFKEPGGFGPIPACPSGWTTANYVPGLSRQCQRQPPAGYSAGDFFLVNNNGFQYTVLLDGAATCSVGNPDNTGCFLGNAPGGTNAFLWSGNFYYSEP